MSNTFLIEWLNSMPYYERVLVFLIPALIYGIIYFIFIKEAKR